MYISIPRAANNFNGADGSLGNVQPGGGVISSAGLIGAIANVDQAFNNSYLSLGAAGLAGGTGGGGGLGGGAGPGLGSTLANAVDGLAGGAGAGLSGTSGDNPVGGFNRGGSGGSCEQPPATIEKTITDHEVPDRFNVGVGTIAILAVSGGGGNGSGLPTNCMSPECHNNCGLSGTPLKPPSKLLGHPNCRRKPRFASQVQDGISIA